MSSVRELTRTSLLAKNSALNLIGSGVPMVVAFLAIPLLIRGLGTDRFGVLTIAWTSIGYFNLFDLGLGRALTQLIAERIGTEREDQISSLAWSALSAMLIMGVIGAVVIVGIAPWLILHALKVPVALRAESLDGFYLLAVALPFVISTAALRGILEANQNFVAVNAIRVPSGIVTYVAPLAVLPFSHRLEPVIGTLVLCRILAWGAHLWLCLRTVPILRTGIRLDRSVLGPLTRFGGWMTISNGASAIMANLDRFMIGGAISMAAVAFYVTPYEAVTKLWMIPAAVMGVLFPALATSYASDRLQTHRLVDRAFRAIFLGLFPIVLVAVAFAHEGLSLWLDAEFALHSTRVLQLLAMGVLINSVGMIGAAALQGAGRPEITGKLNLIELPLYLIALWWLLRTYGIEGAAIAWVARVSVDTFLLTILADRVIHGRVLTRHLLVWLIPGLCCLVVVAFPIEFLSRSILVAVILGIFFGAVWRHGVTGSERAALRRYVLRANAA